MSILAPTSAHITEHKHFHGIRLDKQRLKPICHLWDSASANVHNGILSTLHGQVAVIVDHLHLRFAPDVLLGRKSHIILGRYDAHKGGQKSIQSELWSVLDIVCKKNHQHKLHPNTDQQIRFLVWAPQRTWEKVTPSFLSMPLGSLKNSQQSYKRTLLRVSP